tara:strand:- start:15355 stop:15687 length:333 start_codon:yes stop_codon:yes gene_type:complete
MNTKIQYQSLKSDIKNLSQEQRHLKGQRKDVHFTGERTHAPYQAVAKLRQNKYKLRHMYILYGIIRNKPTGYKPLSTYKMEALWLLYGDGSEYTGVVAPYVHPDRREQAA